MSGDRPTLRPVTIGRLVEVIDLCGQSRHTTDDVVDTLEVTPRRAKEVLREADRIGFVERDQNHDSEVYSQSVLGKTFIRRILNEEWHQSSQLLSENSPHYAACLNEVDTGGPLASTELLNHLQKASREYAFNETGVAVTLDWGERLGAIQRNAFSGQYYRAEEQPDTNQLTETIVSVYRELDETTGIGLRQQFVSIPRLREFTCQRLRSPRGIFDTAIREFAMANVGGVELTGAPSDTGAKEAEFPVKQIGLDDGGAVVSTSQSTDPVQSGVKVAGKRYYYIAIHADDEEVLVQNDE